VKPAPLTADAAAGRSAPTSTHRHKAGSNLLMENLQRVRPGP
jgi:hypothetical protein